MATDEEFFEPELNEAPQPIGAVISAAAGRLRAAVAGRGYWVSGVFLPWYLWSIVFYPVLTLWWLAFSISIMLVGAAVLWPRSVLFWLPPCLLLFNTVYWWLPWPSIKLSYIAPAAVCLAAVIRPGWKRVEPPDRRLVSFDFVIVFLCLLVAALLGLASRFAWTEPAAWYELKLQLRQIPLLHERERYIPLRLVWVWCLSLPTYWVIARTIRGIKDVHTVFWSLQWATLPVAIFGIYSYMTRAYMVSHYVFEQRINATLSSPAVLADMFTVIFILGIYLWRKSASRRARCCLTGLLGVQLVAIMLSGCRTNVLLLGVFGFVWLCVQFLKGLKRRRSLVTTGAVVVSIVGIAIGLLFLPDRVHKRISRIPVIERLVNWEKGITRGRKLKDTFLAGRANHWVCAANMIRETPLWGIGCGFFEQRYVKYRKRSDYFQYARTHSLLLRVCTEGGFVTLAAFVVFLAATCWRLLYSFRKRARRKEPEWSGCLRALAVVFAAIFLSSLVSDIFFENTESVMFLALTAGCAACAYQRIGRLAGQHFLPLRRRLLLPAEEYVYVWMGNIGWGYLGRIRPRSVGKVIVLLVLAFLVWNGVTRAGALRRLEFKRGALQHGFFARVPGSTEPEWRSMGKRAMTGIVVRDPVFSISYRALNDRMALHDQKVRLYIDGTHAATLRLNKTEEQTLYCDVTDLYGKKIAIDLQADRVFVPRVEHWFADSHAYGAVITLPKWLRGKPADLFAKTKGDWCIRWSANPEFYLEQGYTNVVK